MLLLFSHVTTPSKNPSRILRPKARSRYKKKRFGNINIFTLFLKPPEGLKCRRKTGLEPKNLPYRPPARNKLYHTTRNFRASTSRGARQGRVGTSIRPFFACEPQAVGRIKCYIRGRVPNENIGADYRQLAPTNRVLYCRKRV